ncbi:MAG: hypothetical protein JWM64_1522 [Frankiales bacterium]|nr:hypothetical protein [Frankiales bacterium]
MAGTTDVASLRGVEWQLQTMDVDETSYDLGGIDAVLRVSDDDQVGGHGCNHWGGRGKVEAGRVQVSNVSSTMMGCDGVRGQIDDVTQHLLRQGADWVVQEGTLTLTGGGTRLTYRPRPTPWRDPDATTLVEGTSGTAEYRLSWRYSAEHDHLWVSWESRERPGLPVGGSGLGRSGHEDISYLEPTGASVGGRGFVYVPAPLSVDRIAWHGPRGDVELPRYALPPAKTWHLFAGFVDAPTKGGEAIGYAGRDEKFRSRVLPY